jgi:hypothetical protein
LLDIIAVFFHWDRAPAATDWLRARSVVGHCGYYDLQDGGVYRR